MAARMHSCADENAQIGDNIPPESRMHQLSARAAAGHIATANTAPEKSSVFIVACNSSPTALHNPAVDYRRILF